MALRLLPLSPLARDEGDLGALAAMRNRRYAALITGFGFAEARVAIVSPARTATRPPQIVWRPRRLPPL
jgi:hypothetical protein